MVLEYDMEQSYQQSAEIEDVGNMQIRCMTPDGDEYYMATRTSMGKTAVLKFGPLVADLGIIPDSFELSHKIITFKQDKIERDIDYFVNSFKTKITSVENISEDELLQAIPEKDLYLKPISGLED